MSFFPTAAANMLKGRVVRWPMLVELDFDNPLYLWNGFRRLTAGGHTWQPVRGQVTIAGLGQSSSDASSQITATLSGAVVTEEITALAITANRAAYVDKLLKILVQPLDEFWQPIDSPYTICTGIMKAIPIAEAQNQDRSVTRTVTVEAENIYYGRSGVPNSFRADMDQKNRFAGDRGMEFVTSLQNAKVPRPW